MYDCFDVIGRLVLWHVVECPVVLLHVLSDGFTEIAVVDECGLVSSIVGVDVFDGEVVGGEVLFGHSQLGDQDVVALLVQEYIAGLQGDCLDPLTNDTQSVTTNIDPEC